MNTPSTRALLGVMAASVLCTVGLLAAFGPLTPPSGIVTSTAKPLAEVEPRIAVNSANTPGDATNLYRITAPGSYYLTGNINGVPGKHGIRITVAGVTLDLNGFHVSGVGVTGGFSGIRGPDNNDHGLIVRNGTIRDWPSGGLNLSLNDFGARVEGVLALRNGAGGITAGPGCMISDCVAEGNGSWGIYVNQYSTVRGCAAFSNDTDGIHTGQGCTVTDCTAGGNNDSGFNIEGGGTLAHCSAYSNIAHGFELDDGCGITDCTARLNTLDGILCAAECTVRGNTLSGNGRSTPIGAGIHTTGGNNRIEGNNCTENDFGIDIDLSGNVIIRNTCADNTQNFVIVTNNIYGTIADRTAPGSPAAVGNSAAGTMGSTDPNANFAY